MNEITVKIVVTFRSKFPKINQFWSIGTHAEVLFSNKKRDNNFLLSLDTVGGASHPDTLRYRDHLREDVMDQIDTNKNACKFFKTYNF